MPREWLVVGRRQRASHRGGDAEHLEEVAGDERAEHQAPVDVGVDLRHLRVGTREDVGFTAERVELRAREPLAIVVAGARPFYSEHLVHVVHRIDAKQQRVEHRERHGDQAEPERHRGHDGEGNERCAPERAQCVEEVPDRVVDEGGAARVATLVGGERHRAEACQRPCPGLGGGHAFGDELLLLPVDMEGKLVVELAFDAAWREQRAGT